MLQHATKDFGPVPSDLGGFQLLCASEIHAGDLLIWSDGLSAVKEWAEGYIGLTTDADGRCYLARVYRRSPAPVHLDHIQTGPVGKALTHDAGKPPLARLPWAAIHELSNVQVYGFKKYKDFDNYRKGMEVTRNLSCALRHISDYLEGSDRDAESGLNPLSHAFARLGFVLQNLHDGTAIDDRYRKPAKVAA